jgi:hypothetical protein
MQFTIRGYTNDPYLAVRQPRVTNIILNATSPKKQSNLMKYAQMSSSTLRHLSYGLSIADMIVVTVPKTEFQDQH